MWLNIGIFLSIVVLLCLLYKFLVKAVDEDNTTAENKKIKLSYEKPTVGNYKAKLVSVYNDLKDQEGDTIVFGGMYRVDKKELGDFIKNDFNNYLYAIKNVGGIFNSYHEWFVLHITEYSHADERLFFSRLNNYRLEKSEYWYWSKFVYTNETYKRNSWYKIDNGEYYTNDGVIYRFKDWVEVSSFEAWFGENKGNLKGRIELCKDPKEEHWEHFLELEIKAKKDRLQQCKEWVDTVLKKQQKYNDICLTNEVATTPLIHDYETLKNFCNMSGEKVKFEEYEITNYLLIIRNTLTKV